MCSKHYYSRYWDLYIRFDLFNTKCSNPPKHSFHSVREQFAQQLPGTAPLRVWMGGLCMAKVAVQHFTARTKTAAGESATVTSSASRVTSDTNLTKPTRKKGQLLYLLSHVHSDTECNDLTRLIRRKILFIIIINHNHGILSY